MTTKPYFYQFMYIDMFYEKTVNLFSIKPNLFYLVHTEI